ncbi:CFEM domain-containing protein [Stachybotrys elegans]|uniref:CFEM domain-containing protein n=1 Tax=Stachybotrys elegans TaxID=80388 RepID=A0A8K0SVB3_9HYPO|nr:CFEM domain-containing protein [Stachybotrys elegans]
MRFDSTHSPFASSTCAPTDLACACRDTALQSTIQACVLASCRPKEALTAMNIFSKWCNLPIRNRGDSFHNLATSFGVITAVLVVIRMTQYIISPASTPGLDDLFIVLTMFCGIAGTIINTVVLIDNGLGQDVWSISFEMITTFAQWLFFQEFLYFTEITLLKMSLLFFYLRIFGHTRIRNLIIGTLVFNTAFGIVFIIVAGFQCQPVSYNWTRWHGEGQGKCLNINALAWANAAISIATDVWMLALPLSQISSLNLHWKKKVEVGAMFGVGLFVTAVSIIRLKTLVGFSSTHNPTWDQYGVVVWSTIEINVGIICACMPAMRVILARLFPRVMGSKQTNGLYGTSKVSRKATTASRKMGSESVVKTANRDSSTTVGDQSDRGILFSREFTVDYHDEASLVPLQRLS